jgi:cell division protein FtsI/penicillin-binding protein 2
MSHSLPPSSNWRVRLFYVLMLLAAVVLIGRLFNLQVIS